MKRIENLPLHFMPKQSLDNILNDDIYNKDFISYKNKPYHSLFL